MHLPLIPSLLRRGEGVEVYENLGEVLAKIENSMQEKSTIEYIRKG